MNVLEWLLKVPCKLMVQGLPKRSVVKKQYAPLSLHRFRLYNDNKRNGKAPASFCSPQSTLLLAQISKLSHVLHTIKWRNPKRSAGFIQLT